MSRISVVRPPDLASIQELFVTAPERALAIVRQTPFMVLTYALAGGVPLLVAFSTAPDTSERCCVTDRHDCNAVTPCGCYADDRSRPSTYNSSMASTNMSTYFDGAYATLCREAIEGRGLNGSSILQSQDEVCSAPGLDRTRLGICALLVLLLGSCLYLAVPPARRASARTATATSTSVGTPPPIAKRRRCPASREGSLLDSLCSVLSRRAFRVYTTTMLLNITWAVFFGSNINIYLVYVIGMKPDQIPAVQIALGVPNLAARVACIPLWTRALLRMPERCHPARVFACVRTAMALVILLFVLCLRQPGFDLNIAAFFFGIVTGILDSPVDMCQHLLIGWAIDEDALSRGGPRREGMHYAANGMIQHLSGAINGIVLVAWGASGFDAKLCVHEQPRSARDAIDYSFLIGLPLLSLLTALVVYTFPIQGERLRQLQKKTNHLSTPPPPPPATTSSASGL